MASLFLFLLFSLCLAKSSLFQYKRDYLYQEIKFSSLCQFFSLFPHLSKERDKEGYVGEMVTEIDSQPNSLNSLLNCSFICRLVVKDTE